jgi:hypothetical protein
MLNGTLEVSNTSLNKFNTCQKKWYWDYIAGLKPRYRASNLTLGKTVHEAFDMFYKGKPLQEIINHIDKTYKEEMGKQALEDQEPLYLDGKIALGMFLNYPYKNLKFDEIESEVEFRVKLGKGIEFVGRVDGRVLHLNKRWVREVKTTGEDKIQFEKKMATSAQNTGYVFGVREHTGENIHGVICDYLRKPRLQKRQTETMQEFGQRIYQDYCDKKKEKMYFHRVFTYRTENDLKRWKEDVFTTCKHLRKCMKDNEYSRNTSACWMYRTECPYYRICFQDTIDPLLIDLFYEQKGGLNGKSEVCDTGHKEG